MIIVFVIDTSASMNQITGNGLTLLDCAKSAAEHFIKQRGRDPSSRTDRYLLVVFSKGSNDAVKVGWENCGDYGIFMKELKNLVARDLSDTGRSLKYAFELLNQYRLITGIDNYAQGQYCNYIDPATFILLTDASAFTTPDGVEEHLNLPASSHPGSDLTNEPYRWDQRLFTIALKLPACSTRSMDSSTPRCPNALRVLSEATGGTAYITTTLRGVLQSVDQIIGKMQKLGPVVNFQADMGMNGEEFNSIKSLLQLNPSKKEYFWPIPESYWVDRSLTSLPSRPAQPTIRYQRVQQTVSASATNKMVLETLKFPVDTFVLDSIPNPAPPRGERWDVYVNGSGNRSDSKIGDPIGFIRTTSSSGGSGSNVVFTLGPYNYPVLFSLLVEAVRGLDPATHVQNGVWLIQTKNLSSNWRQNFSAYLSKCPAYYYTPLKKALKRFNLHTLVTELPDGGRSYQISSYLKRLREIARQEADKAQSASRNDSASNNHNNEDPNTMSNKTNKGNGIKSNLIKKSEIFLLHQDLKNRVYRQRYQPKSGNGQRFRTDSWNGPLARLTPTDKALIEDKKHAIPIGDMGSYQELLIKKEAPRDPMKDPEPDEDKPSGIRRRQLQVHFGNPYRKSATKQSSSSEADEAMDEAAILQEQCPKKSRKRSSRRQSRLSKCKKLLASGVGLSPILSSPSSSPLRSPSSTISDTESESSPSRPSSPQIQGTFMTKSPTMSPRLGLKGHQEEDIDMDMEAPGALTKRVNEIVKANEDSWSKILNLIRQPRSSNADARKISDLLQGLSGGVQVISSFSMSAIHYAQQFRKTQLVEELERLLEQKKS